MKHRLIPVIVFLLGGQLAAQDIEVTAQERRRVLPRGYYERIQQEPDAFELRGGWRTKLAAAQANASAVEGTLPLVVIPVLFSDSPTPGSIIASSVLQTRLFDPVALTTVTSYYSAVSLGKLRIGGQVTDWVSTSWLRANVVGTSFGLGADAKTRDWLREAIANVDGSVDFGQFDNDGADGVPNSGDDDGRVDGTAFLFSEIDASCGGPGIWPHRSRFSGGGNTGVATNDRRPNGTMIVVDDYMVLGARNCMGQGALEVNVFAHETGHVLGLPDYYDSSVGLLREQRRWVVGCWDLMSGGAWGCGTGAQPSGFIPSHMGAYTKSLLGWNAPKLVTNLGLQLQEHTLRPAHATGDALRIPLSQFEYLLVEYRTRQGHDISLPSSGVVVYHIETGRAFLPCALCPRTYSYAVVEADGDSALVRLETAGGNRGAAGDAFAISRNVMDDSTIPSTRLNDGARTWVRLSRIVVDAAQGIARVTVSLLPSALTIERLISAFGAAPLAAADVSLLDAAGNSNGRFDVGDLRAFMKIRAADP